MSNRLIWLRLVIITIPILVILCGLNYYEDPANIFHDESKEIGKVIAEGKAAYAASGNGNEIEVKHNVIINMPDHLECIAVGPSLVMSVNKSNVGTDDFINLGHSSADFYDILAQFGLMEYYGKTYDRVIFCVDSYFFDDTKWSKSDLACFSDYMISILKGNDFDTKELNVDNSYSFFKKIEQIFSITYFQASCDQIHKNNSLLISGLRWGLVGEDFDGSKPYYDVDGSWVYALSYQNNDLDFVKNQSEEYDIERRFTKDRHINEYSKEIFDVLIQYLMNQGVEVEFFLCPCTPTLWNRIEAESDHYHILDECSDFANEEAKKYNLKVIGSYNPYDLNISDEEFYDARHVRREKLDKYFDFLTHTSHTKKV